MLFAIALLFLSAILMTQANTIEDDVTNIEPLSEEVFIFDVISDAPVAELKGAVKSAGVEVRHSFQVLGTRQYLFVVVGDLSQLTFPEGSVVTQHPVQHFRDFYKLFETSGWDGNDTEDALDNTNLHVVIWEHIVPHGTSTAQYKKMMQDLSGLHAAGYEKLKPVPYAAVGRIPGKIFNFVNLDENSLQKAILHGLDAGRGPGNNLINILRLRKV